MFGMNKYILKNNLPSFIAAIVLVILIILIVRSYNTYQDDKSQTEILNNDIQQLDARMKISKANKELGGNKINEYNRLLNQLIPESEDFFSIIYAFEQIAKKTGFNVTNYTIKLSSSTKEKYALTVQGTGDMNSFLTFLKKYHFGSGRLITNESIDFLPNTGVRTVILSLNFYNKKTSLGKESINAILPADVRLMDQIKDKVSVNFVAPSSEDVSNYTTKDNPF